MTQPQISQEQITNRLILQISKLDGGLAHYNEKQDVQSKRLKYLKKQNQELKHKKVDTFQNSKQIKEQNSFLKEQNKKLKDQLKTLQNQIALYDHSYGSKGPKEVALKDTIVTSHSQEIDLSKSGVTDQDIDSVKSFTNIKTLIMGQNEIGNEGMRIICTNLTQMKKLFLNHNQISNEGLAQISNLKHLRCLDLRCNKISDQGLQYIGRLASLSQLSISNNSLSDSGMIHLTNLKQLKYLDITSNKLALQGGLLLVQIPQLTNLYLSHNKIPSECVYRFLDQLKQLRVLDVRFNQITKQQKEIIKTEKEKNEGLKVLQLFL